MISAVICSVRLFFWFKSSLNSHKSHRSNCDVIPQMHIKWLLSFQFNKQYLVLVQTEPHKKFKSKIENSIAPLKQSVSAQLCVLQRALLRLLQSVPPVRFKTANWLLKVTSSLVMQQSEESQPATHMRCNHKLISMPTVSPCFNKLNQPHSPHCDVKRPNKSPITHTLPLNKSK